MAKHVLRRDEFSAEKKAYLKALEKHRGDIELAVKESEIKQGALWYERRLDASFAAAEAEIGARFEGEPWQQRTYFHALIKHYGNKTKARRDAMVDRGTMAAWEKNADFREREQEIFATFVDEANEQNLRLMLGANPKVRDGQHLRWGLAKVDPRWEDKPKTIEHRYTGNVTLKDTQERIRELLRPEDVVDADIIEG